MSGELKDIQVASKIAKDMGGAGIGYVTFNGQPNANDILTIGARAIEFDGAGANINVTIGGTLALTLAAAVIAINADGTILADAHVGANDNCLNFVARAVGVAGNLGIVDTTDTAAAMVVSAALMTGGKAVAVTEVYQEQYTITAEDVTAMAGGGIDAEICVLGVPKITAPLSSQITAWDTTGLIHPFTSLLFVWRQAGATNNFGLFLEDSAAVFQAGDTIDVIAFY